MWIFRGVRSSLPSVKNEANSGKSEILWRVVAISDWSMISPLMFIDLKLEHLSLESRNLCTSFVVVKSSSSSSLSHLLHRPSPLRPHPCISSSQPIIHRNGS